MQVLPDYLMKDLVLSAIDVSDDKASVAKLCRTAIEQKVMGITVADDNLSFAWNCLERTKTKVHVHYYYKGTNATVLNKKLIHLFEEGADIVELSLSSSFFKVDDLESKMEIFFQPLISAKHIHKLILVVSDDLLSTREQIAGFVRACDALKVGGIKIDISDDKRLLVLAYRLFDMYAAYPFGVIKFRLTNLNTMENLFRLTSKMISDDQRQNHRICFEFPFEKFLRIFQ